jgi:hypothetical protein
VVTSSYCNIGTNQHFCAKPGRTGGLAAAKKSAARNEIGMTAAGGKIGTSDPPG